jgi:hypothetical protein
MLSPKADLAASLGIWQRGHELADGVDQLSDCRVMRVNFLFQLCQLAGKLRVGRHKLAYAPCSVKA